MCDDVQPFNDDEQLNETIYNYEDVLQVEEVEETNLQNLPDFTSINSYEDYVYKDLIHAEEEEDTTVYF